MSFDSALFEHIESSPSRTVSAAQAALHLGNQPVPQVRRKLIQLAEAAGGSIQVRFYQGTRPVCRRELHNRKSTKIFWVLRRVCVCTVVFSSISVSVYPKTMVKLRNCHFSFRIFEEQENLVIFFKLRRCIKVNPIPLIVSYHK